ncbi:pyruvate dehydrogenase (acetyl-transferring) E1 component subunit alpha, partial [Candidatus Peregrinibacteria bacterium]|nr:pyruvate dehydrogenase (acetyl-transferring) E1 component subunit alpha [Candidatus Peregrinibacteria bacterium]
MLLDKFDPLKNQMVQILDENGSHKEDILPKDLSLEAIKELYEKMLFVRLADTRALKMQRSGRMGTYASVEGQEAVQLGSHHALDKNDWIVPAFRETAVMWAHGVPMEDIYLYWIGNERGSHMPEGVNVLPVSIPVGSHMLHAVGLSWAAQMRQENQLAVAYFGDGATSEGDFHEAMNFAGVYKTPTIFICQNNQFAISTLKSHQTASDNYAMKAVAYGFPGVLVDGMDLLAMYAVTKEAVERARNGYGPTLIEAYTYRYGDHTTSDDAKVYRKPEEIEQWRKKDPLIRLQKFLAKNDMWNQKDDDALREKLQKKVDEITEKALNTPDQTIDELFD